MFDKIYFECFHKYGEKELDVKLQYFKVLEWANRYVDFDLFNGTNRKALDVGCGYGYVMDMLKSFGYAVFGIDVSCYALRRAKELLSKRSRQFTLLVHDIQKPLPLRIKFDLITCFEVLEHLPKPLLALKNMYNSLKPNGVLVARTPNKFAIYHTLLDRDPTHINVRSYIEWKRMLVNFDGNIKIDCYTWIPTLGVRRCFLRVPLIGSGVWIFLQKKTSGELR